MKRVLRGKGRREALLLLSFLPSHPDYFDVAWRMSLCGAGFGLFLSPNARLIIGSAPRERAASAGGLISTTRLSQSNAGAKSTMSSGRTRAWGI